MPPSQDQIARLKAAIMRQQSEAADLEAEIIDLERDLETFTRRYARLVQPKIDRLEIIQQMIKDLENEIAQRNAPPPHDPPLAASHGAWTPPPDYVPVEEQFRRAWQVPPKDERETQASASTTHAIPYAENGSVRSDLKRLYRTLVRRYHPDLATDPSERERRNRLMAEINAAYSDGDHDALEALAAQPEAASLDEPLATIELRQLQQIHEQLSERIAWLKSKRHELMHGDMMWLKIQSTLAAREGHDYLQSLADRLDAEYAACLDRFDELKRRLL